MRGAWCVTPVPRLLCWVACINQINRDLIRTFVWKITAQNSFIIHLSSQILNMCQHFQVNMAFGPSSRLLNELPRQRAWLSTNCMYFARKIISLKIVDNYWGHIKIKTFCEAKNLTAEHFETLITTLLEFTSSLFKTSC